jgi:hypothetical protein
MFEQAFAPKHGLFSTPASLSKTRLSGRSDPERRCVKCNDEDILRTCSIMLRRTKGMRLSGILSQNFQARSEMAGLFLEIVPLPESTTVRTVNGC